MKIIFSIIFFTLSLSAFSATCTTTSRNNYSANSVLTSTALNADFNQLVTKANAFDGGCVTDGTLESDALNTTQFAPMLKGIREGCKVTYSSATTVSISKCLAAVNGEFVSTSTGTTVSFGCTSCSAETASTTYYVYIATGSSGTTLTPLILTTAPNEDGYDNSGNKVVARFYNNASSDIDQYSIDQWKVNSFAPSNVIASWTPTGAWVSNTTYTGQLRRVGAFLVADVSVTVSGAPTSATLTINLPTGLLIDTARITSGTSTAAAIESYAVFNDAGVVRGPGSVTYASTSSITVKVIDAGSTHASLVNVTQAVPMTWASGDFAHVYFRVPIVGWED